MVDNEASSPPAKTVPTQTLTTNEPTESDAPESKSAIVRRFRENTAFFSDLFKLKVAKMLLWKGFKKDSLEAAFDEDGNLNEDWFHVEHCHFFHTVDSNGKVQDYSVPVGQHFHKMKVIRDPNKPSEIISVECASGPLKWSIVKKYGKRQRGVVPFSQFDEHKHETIYLKSDKLHRPDMNPDAVKVIGAHDAKGSKDVYDENGKSLGRLEVRG